MEILSQDGVVVDFTGILAFYLQYVSNINLFVDKNSAGVISFQMKDHRVGEGYTRQYIFVMPGTPIPDYVDTSNPRLVILKKEDDLLKIMFEVFYEQWENGN